MKCHKFPQLQATRHFLRNGKLRCTGPPRAPEMQHPSEIHKEEEREREEAPSRRQHREKWGGHQQPGTTGAIRVAANSSLSVLHIPLLQRAAPCTQHIHTGFSSHPSVHRGEMKDAEHGGRIGARAIPRRPRRGVDCHVFKLAG